MAANNENNPDTGYMHIQYQGDPSRPYPEVIFYLGGSLDLPCSNDTTHDGFFVHKIEVTEKEFNDVRKSIEESKLEINPPVIPDPIAFAIVRNCERKVIFDRYIGSIRETFDKIVKQFGGSNKQELVKKFLDGI